MSTWIYHLEQNSFMFKYCWQIFMHVYLVWYKSWRALWRRALAEDSFCPAWFVFKSVGAIGWGDEQGECTKQPQKQQGQAADAPLSLENPSHQRLHVIAGRRKSPNDCPAGCRDRNKTDSDRLSGKHLLSVLLYIASAATDTHFPCMRLYAHGLNSKAFTHVCGGLLYLCMHVGQCRA